MTNDDDPKKQEEMQSVLDLHTVSQLMQIQQDLLHQATQRRIFSDYRANRKPNTRKRQHGDLARFRMYLDTVLETTGVTLVDEQGQPLELGADPSLPLWRIMTNGLVKGFREWMFRGGYTFETIKDSLSTVRIYCGLAAQAKVLSTDELTRIREIKGYRHAQAEELEAQREIHCRGHKKVEETLLTEAELERLLQVPDRSRPQGWRDLFLLLLLYDLGVRPSELVTARIADLNLKRGLLRVYRHKTNEKEQWLELSRDAWEAANHYLDLRHDTRADAPLLITTRKNGQFIELVEQDGEHQPAITPGISGRKLLKRVHDLGMRVGLDISHGTQSPQRG